MKGSSGGGVALPADFVRPPPLAGALADCTGLPIEELLDARLLSPLGISADLRLRVSAGGG